VPARPRAIPAGAVCLCLRRVRAGVTPTSPKPRRVRNAAVTTVIVLFFAILLCLVNAVVWTVVSEMPMMGLAWLVAAVFCVVIQKWNKG